MDKTDVLKSDFVLLYAGIDGIDSEILRGACIEAGMAIGAGRRVVTVALSGHHTWAHAAEVIKLPTMEEARQFFFRYHVNTEGDNGK